MAITPIHISITEFDGRGRRIRNITVSRTVAVIHGADEGLLLALFVLALATELLTIATSIFMEEAILAGRFGLLAVVLLALLILLGSLAIGLGCWGLAALASTAAPTMALGLLPLTLDRLPFRHRSLRLVLLSCHACTSWCVLTFLSACARSCKTAKSGLRCHLFLEKNAGKV
jgi:hypothetical protein